jgi:serine/threonine-protein kinase
MELVEGPTLADRLADGPLAVDEAIAVARQVADGLEAAHGRGIVHRDLKPANVKVRSDGFVKILDFGLAKAQAPAPGSASLTQAPTITTPAMMTGVGVILGTAAYMSPEQAKGREADIRSDIWSFGAMLFEMLTARRAFEGEDVGDTLASVIKSDPDWTRLPADVPGALRTLLQRCLAKDRKQRPSGMAAVAYVLSASHAPESLPAAESSEASASGRGARAWAVPAAAALLSAAIAGGIAWALRPAPPTTPITRFTFSLPPGQQFARGSTRQLVAISPDGSRMAYVSNNRIYLREMAESEPRELQGTLHEAGVLNPMFSPDGAAIAYVEVAGTVLKRVPAGGGVAETLASGVGLPCGGSWDASGLLIASRRLAKQGVWRVPSAGGSPELIVETKAGEEACGPQLLPDHDAVLFTLASITGDNRWDEARILVQSVSDGTRQVLLEGGSDGRYLPSGHLVYAVGGTVYARRFDAKRGVVGAEAVPVVEGVRRSTGGQPTSASQLAVSDSGTLVYIPGPATASASTYRLVRAGGAGDPVALDLPAAAYSTPRISPDGETLAVMRVDGRETNIWLYDLSGKTQLRRLTFDGDSRFPVWSADGQRVTFQSGREGDQAVWSQPVSGGAAERLTKPAAGDEHVPESWSKDGQLLVTLAKSRTWPPTAGTCSCSLWIRAPNGAMRRFNEISSGNLFNATLSPDGRWVAYSVATGRALDDLDRGVYVEAFPPAGVRRQAPKTSARDYHPAWAPDGKRLFYVPESFEPMVAVPFTTTPTVAFGAADPMRFQQELPSWQPRGYDVLPDGRLVALSLDVGAPEIRVVLNWFEELKRRVAGP